MLQHHYKNKNKIFVFLCFFFAVSNTQSAEWVIKEGIRLSSNFSDNQNLNEDNKKGYILNFSPYIDLDSKSSHNLLKIKYSPTISLTNGERKITDIDHYLTSNLTSTLIDQFLFLDVGANAQLIPVSNNFPTSIDSDSNNSNNNLTQSIVFKISPYIKQRFGNYAFLNARFNTDRVINTGSNLNRQSQAYDFKVNLQNGVYFNRFIWSIGLTHHQQKEETNEQIRSQQLSTTDQQSLDGYLGYRYNRQWQFGISMGYERNNIKTRNDISGAYIGFRAAWLLSPRTNFSFGYSRRAFGDSWDISFNHLSRRSTISLTYNTTLSDSRREQLRTITLFGNDQAGNLISRDFTFTTILGDFFVLNRLAFEYKLKGIRNSIGYIASVNMRKFLLANFKENTYFTGINWGHDFSKRVKSTVNLSAFLLEKNRALINQSRKNRTTYILSIGSSFKPARKTTFSTTYSYRKEIGNIKFDENRLLFSMNYQF